MTTTTKVLIGVGVLAAIGAVWYFATMPKPAGTVIVNRPATAAIPSNVATDIAVATTAAGIASQIANQISSNSDNSDDGSDDDGSMSGINYYNHPRLMIH
jgi:uncharacterized protein (UPF0333 family)